MKTEARENRTFRPRPHVSGYFQIRNFSFPDTATVHTYPANSTANPEKNKSALQSGKKYIRNDSDNVCTGPERKKINPLFRVEKKYIRNDSDNVWTGESGYFFIQ